MTKYILFFIGCCILFAPLRSQNVEPIKFVHIGLNEGLSQSTIFGITQDKQGNMWFATYNGLNKYNGYDFTVYQHDEHNPHSISNDIIRSCTADRLGKIWIGTDSGLSFYNADKDRFENFSSEDRGEQYPSMASWSSTITNYCCFPTKKNCYCSTPKPRSSPVKCRNLP